MSKSLVSWKSLAVLTVTPLMFACGDSGEKAGTLPDGGGGLPEAGGADVALPVPDAPVSIDHSQPADLPPRPLDTAAIDAPAVPVDVPIATDVAPVDVQVTEAAPVCTIVPAFKGGILTTSRTLTRACSPYLIEDTIRVEGTATLTIEAGVTMRFARNTELTVGYSDGGKLIAQGTAAEPIVLTSAAPTPAGGDWTGINFYRDAVLGSQLSYVTLDYCGKANVGCIEGQSGMPPGAVTIDHVVIDHVGAGGDGILQNGSNLAFKITNTTFPPGAIPAGRFAIVLDAESFAGVGPGNVFNSAPINIDGGFVTTTATWINPGTTIVVTDDIRVEGPASPILTLSPGTVMQFATNQSLWVGYTEPGQLIAVGTATAPIVLTSRAATPGPGDWEGIHLWPDTANGTKLGYLKLDYCGTPNGACIEVDPAVKTGFAAIDHVIIDHVGAQADGIIASGTTSSIPITNCTFPAGAIQAGRHAIVVEAPSFAAIGAGNTFNGAGIAIGAGDTGTTDIETTTTWVNPGTPITVTELIRVQGAATPVLTLGAGMAFRFAADTGIWVGYGDPGKLVVNGTAAAHVTMTSMASTPVAGDWQGIIVWNNSQATLAYADIAYAGGYGNVAGGVAANSEDAVVSLTNCSISNSAGYGVYIDCDNPNVTATGCTFTGNAAADLGPGPTCP